MSALVFDSIVLLQSTFRNGLIAAHELKDYYYYDDWMCFYVAFIAFELSLNKITR